MPQDILQMGKIIDIAKLLFGELYLERQNHIKVVFGNIKIKILGGFFLPPNDKLNVLDWWNWQTQGRVDKMSPLYTEMYIENLSNCWELLLD